MMIIIWDRPSIMDHLIFFAKFKKSSSSLQFSLFFHFNISEFNIINFIKLISNLNYIIFNRNDKDLEAIHSFMPCTYSLLSTMPLFMQCLLKLNILHDLRVCNSCLSDILPPLSFKLYSRNIRV